MKKIFTFIAAALFAVSASATLIWSESLDKNGTYIDKSGSQPWGTNWPYANQWYDAGNFVFAYDSVKSYTCTIRGKKLNGGDSNTIGFYFGANKTADKCYLRLFGKDDAIVEGAVNCKLMFDLCAAEVDGGDAGSLIVKVNGVQLPGIDLALGNQLVTSAVEWTLTDGDIKSIEIAFDKAPAQRFISNLRIEGEAGTAHGQGGITPPVEELDTISATEALARAQALEVGKTEKVVIVCYIASIKTAFNSQYNNISLWLNDDPTSTYGEISTYRTKVSAEVGPTLAAGDKVQIVGNLSHSTYTPEGSTELKHSYQVAEGAELTLLEKAQGIENVVLTEKANKVMVDGVMYIVRDGKMFNVQGAQVR